jgi:hypothetical protein
MSIRYRVIVASSVVAVCAAGFLGYGIRAVLSAANTLQDHPLMTVNHARTAQAKFNDARAAMERGLLLREVSPAAYVGTLESAMKDVMNQLKVVNERMAPGTSSESIKRAQALAQEWHQAGLKIIKPPQGGVTELPLPMMVVAKGKAAAAALDQVVAETSAFALHSVPRAEVAGAQ